APASAAAASAPRGELSGSRSASFRSDPGRRRLASGEGRRSLRVARPDVRVDRAPPGLGPAARDLDGALDRGDGRDRAAPRLRERPARTVHGAWPDGAGGAHRADRRGPEEVRSDRRLLLGPTRSDRARSRTLVDLTALVTCLRLVPLVLPCSRRVRARRTSTEHA